MTICNEHLLEHNLMQKLIGTLDANMDTLKEDTGSATTDHALAMATNLLAYVLDQVHMKLDEPSPTDGKPFSYHLIEMVRMQLSRSEGEE